MPRLLADLFSIAMVPEKDVPTAALAVNKRFQADVPADNCWIEGHPVILQPDRDRLVLQLADQRKLSGCSNKQELADSIQKHFSPLFKKIYFTEYGSWLFELDNQPAISTTPLLEVIGQNVERFLPEGKDKRHWHSIINELQMLLHTQQAEQCGFNSLWFEGAGKLPQVLNSKPDMMIIGNDRQASDFAHWASVPCLEKLTEIKWGSQSLDKAIVLESSIMQAIHHQSEQAWFQAMKDIEHQLGEILSLLKNGSIYRLMIYPLDGSFFQLGRADIRKFWKRPGQLADFVDAGQ